MPSSIKGKLIHTFFFFYFVFAFMETPDCYVNTYGEHYVKSSLPIKLNNRSGNE